MSDNKYIPRTFQTPNAHVDEIALFKMWLEDERMTLAYDQKTLTRVEEQFDRYIAPLIIPYAPKTDEVGE